MPYSPFMASVILTTAGTQYQLSALLAAIDANLPKRATVVIIQYDLTNAGNLYIGNKSGSNIVASNNCGSHLVPTQALNVAAYDTGVTLTSDIWLVSDTNSVQVNVTVLPIGM